MIYLRTFASICGLGFVFRRQFVCIRGSLRSYWPRWRFQRIVLKGPLLKGRFCIGRRSIVGKTPGMNPLEHQIFEVLQASCDGHSTAFNVFNVLNTDGYNVTKHEFEEACKQLHDCTCITYWPIRTSLMNMPIGTLELLTKSPASVLPFSKGANSAFGIEALGEDSTAESSTIRRNSPPAFSRLFISFLKTDRVLDGESLVQERSHLLYRRRYL